jgi:hypothetical protein
MLRHRLFWPCVGFVSICTLGAIVYAPQGARGQTPSVQATVLRIMVPHFMAEAVRFRAIDESGYDWAGSDEIYAVFSDLNPNVNDLVTQVFDDVDTGETRDFGPQERCIAPRPTCDHGVSEILHFKFSLWERDQLPFAFCPRGAELTYGICPEDDIIGIEEVFMSREQLLAALPSVGNSVEQKRILGGPCGYIPPGDICGYGWLSPTGPEYEVTFRITRLPDVESRLFLSTTH